MNRKTSKQIVGREGEDQACEFLINKGHTILARNWRSSHLELDIVSLSKDGLHFVEVKTRVAPVMAAPEMNVDWSKQRKITAAAGAFLKSSSRYELGGDLEIFFDVISVVIGKEKTEIEYYPQAFIPIYA